MGMDYRFTSGAMRLMRIFLTVWALAGTLLVWGVEGARGATAVLNVSCGYLLDEAGTSATDRVGEGTLCVLVADLAGDGFDAPGTGWVAGDDVLVVVSDSEFPATLPGGGTRGFDLASGVTEPGLFSRSLVVDLSQFSGRTAPVPVALRWFPGLKAAEVQVAAAGGGPPVGTAYGEFSRAVPLYPESGSAAWVIPLGGGGENVTLDPLATPELGGKDAASLGSASLRTGTSGGGTPPSGVVLALNPGGTVTVLFSGGAGLKYKVQRSVDLGSWPAEWTVTADGQGAGTLTDTAPPAGRAFYRVVGPVEP